MAGLKDKRGFIDKDRLDLSERQAVEYWMKRWGVNREQLTAAHRRAGRVVIGTGPSTGAAPFAAPAGDRRRRCRRPLGLGPSARPWAIADGRQSLQRRRRRKSRSLREMEALPHHHG